MNAFLRTTELRPHNRMQFSVNPRTAFCVEYLTPLKGITIDKTLILCTTREYCFFKKIINVQILTNRIFKQTPCVQTARKFWY